MTLTVVRLLLACCLVAGAVVDVAGDFKESYRRGIQARNRRNWPEAVQWFTRAIKEQPAETGESVLMAQGAFEPYLPYFQLGMSHYNMQECVPALDAWKASLQAQVVLRSKYAGEFKKARFDCEGRVAKGEASPPPPPTPVQPTAPPVDPAELKNAVQAAQAAIASAERLVGVVGELGAHPLLKSEFLLQSEVTGGQTRAQTFLTDARASLEKGQKVPDLDAVRTATSLASSAEQQLALLQKAVQNRIDALDEARKANVPPPPPASSTTAPPPVSNPGLPGEPKSTAGPLTAPPAPAKSEPGLIGVVEAFTSGRYRDAIARAEKLRHLTGRDGAQAALFSAAANYQLFLRGGARDRALHDAARRDAATAKKLDPTLLPDLRMFSPRFAEFYRGVR